MGYGTSKWAAEQVLQSAHRRFGLPVNVFRGDMMLAHRRYQQQINGPDVFTRLLSSVIMTGLAPVSFHPLKSDGSRPRAHYDGLPVDFVAAAVVGISLEPHHEIRTFHVLNHHVDDGISLDTFVDWIEEAGYPVERVARICRLDSTVRDEAESASGGEAPSIIADRHRITEAATPDRADGGHQAVSGCGAGPPDRS